MRVLRPNIETGLISFEGVPTRWRPPSASALVVHPGHAEEAGVAKEE
jgi:hypothetical protein